MDGAWYWFNDSCAMARGWRQIGDSYYYFGESGAMQTGWLNVGGSRFWLGDSGIMATGWQTVDGVRHEFRKVWLAPTMNGRFYGGGMMPTPNQNRLGLNRSLSVMVFFGSSKLKTLAIFPSIFKGEHIKHPEMCTVLTGKEIRVEFDRPTALQIDGETILGVTEYTVTSKVPAAV